MIFSTQLLLTQKPAVTVKSVTLDEQMKLIDQRAKQMTSVLEHIEGFSHGGLNE